MTEINYRYYSSLPIVGEISESFLNYLFQLGYQPLTVKVKATDFFQIIRWLQQIHISNIHDLTVEQIEQWWREYHTQKINLAGTIQQLKNFLLAQGIIDQPALVDSISPVEDLLEKYRDSLIQLKGFSNSTVQHHIRYSRRFLEFIKTEEKRLDLSTLTLDQIHHFIEVCCQTMCRSSLMQLTNHLRSLLRYLFQQDLVQCPLYQQIDHPKLYRLEKLPRVLSRSMVLDLLKSIDRSSWGGLRDYAILYLAAHYGLRCSEISMLKMENIQWHQRIMAVYQSKTGKTLYLPLTEEATEAIGQYIHQERPNDLPYREVFLRLTAPYGKLKPATIGCIFDTRAKKSGLPIPFHGSHCLRHSLASHMLEQGKSATVIGDLFGHQSLESTSTYLRVQLESLRRMVLPIPTVSASQSSNSVDSYQRLQQLIYQAVTTIYTRKQTPKKHRRCHRNHELHSFLQKEIQAYLKLQRSLGKGYQKEEEVLNKWDRFLWEQEQNKLSSLQCFSHQLMDSLWRWLGTLESLTDFSRRKHFLVVRKFLVYVSRLHAEIIVPDFLWYPKVKSCFHPYTLTEEQVAQLLLLAKHLPSIPKSPARATNMYIGILLLYTTGMRRGELLALRWQDYDPHQKVITIRETKFHKSRLIPINDAIAYEIQQHQKRLMNSGFYIQEDQSLLPDFYGKSFDQNKQHQKSQIRGFSAPGFSGNWSILCLSTGIVTDKGKSPRIHDLRHSFAINNLNRFYEEKKNPNAELPLLSAYMGHVSIVSTQRYLSQMHQSLFVANDWFLSYVQKESNPSQFDQLPSRKKGEDNWIEGRIVSYFHRRRKE